MVRPIGPVKIVCKNCNWEKKMSFESDALYGVPDKCPKCGAEEIRMKQDIGLKGRLFGFISKL